MALKLARIRDTHQRKSAWTAVLLVSLPMPWLMRATAVPLIPTPLYWLHMSPIASPRPAPQYPWHGLGALYALIAAALVCIYVVSWLRVWRIYRSALVVHAGWTRGMSVRVSPLINAPATFGRTILLPEGFRAWSEQKRTAVMAHERAHVLERDAYLLWLAQIYSCLFWFNPAAWWVRRELAALAEGAADEAALAAVGDRPGYAQILLELAGHPRLSGSTLSMSHANVSGRIDHILRATGESQAPAPWRRLLAFTAVLPVAIATAALQLAPTQPVHAKTPTAAHRSQAAAQQPHIVSYGRLARLADYYPSKAKRSGIDGLVRLAVTLDPRGRPSDTRILLEKPAGQGFGAAASALARTFRYSNPTGQPSQLTFQVRFALSRERTK